MALSSRRLSLVVRFAIGAVALLTFRQILSFWMIGSSAVHSSKSKSSPNLSSTPLQAVREPGPRLGGNGEKFVPFFFLFFFFLFFTFLKSLHF
jgi:hypothetical protein